MPPFRSEKLKRNETKKYLQAIFELIAKLLGHFIKTKNTYGYLEKGVGYIVLCIR